MRRADPNAGHRALAALDPGLLITQNVDGLHERAGGRSLVALHGRIADVVCLGLPGHLDACRAAGAPGRGEPRLRWTGTRRSRCAPTATSTSRRPPGFVVPGCETCGGVLKPDVVFFGENVPAERVARCYAAVDGLADTGGVLLVAGSSLTVMSGFRFVRRAAKAGIPVVIVNRGTTRGDELATYRLDVGCSEFLSALAS